MRVLWCLSTAVLGVSFNVKKTIFKQEHFRCMSTSVTSPSTFLDKIGQSVNYLVQKPVRLKYSSVISGRVGWFISQGIGIRALGVDSSANRLNGSEFVPIVTSIFETLVTSMAEEPVTLPINADFKDDPQKKFFNSNFGAILTMLKKDLQNIENGLYKYPYDMEPSTASRQWNAASVISQLGNYVQDRRSVIGRRSRRDGLEIRKNFISNKYPGTITIFSLFYNYLSSCCTFNVVEQTTICKISIISQMAGSRLNLPSSTIIRLANMYNRRYIVCILSPLQSSGWMRSSLTNVVIVLLLSCVWCATHFLATYSHTRYVSPHNYIYTHTYTQTHAHSHN